MAPSLRSRKQVKIADTSSSEPGHGQDRPRRAATANKKFYEEPGEDEDADDYDEEESTITVERPQPQKPNTTIKLKLKMPASRLRESATIQNAPVVSKDEPKPATPTSGARSNRARRQVVVESESEEEEDDDEKEQSEEEEDSEEDDEEEDAEDAEGDSDVEMEDAPAPTVTWKSVPSAHPTITITSAAKPNKVKSVEAKEISMATGEDYDDDDLSDLSDEEDIVEDEEDAEGDSFDDEDMSRSGTPGLTKIKMTKRQRASASWIPDDYFIALNMGKSSITYLPDHADRIAPNTKLQLTDEQRNLRRTEMARRRKNLSEKRNEEEKQDTINRLLKKQAPKRRGKISAAEIAAGGETPDVVFTGIEEDIVKPHPAFSRLVSGPDGIRLGLPGEWKDTVVGKPFGHKGWKLIEEIG